jgi:hypothetical protein
MLCVASDRWPVASARGAGASSALQREAGSSIGKTDRPTGDTERDERDVADHFAKCVREHGAPVARAAVRRSAAALQGHLRGHICLHDGAPRLRHARSRPVLQRYGRVGSTSTCLRWDRQSRKWDRQSGKWDQRSGVNLVCDAVNAQHLPERLCAAVAQLPRPLPELVACGSVLTHCTGPAIEGAGTAAAPTRSSVTDAVRSRAGLEANMRWRPKCAQKASGEAWTEGRAHKPPYLHETQTRRQNNG